jgi:hypothetical protein
MVTVLRRWTAIHFGMPRQLVAMSRSARTRGTAIGAVLVLAVGAALEVCERQQQTSASPLHLPRRVIFRERPVTCGRGLRLRSDGEFACDGGRGGR